MSISSFALQSNFNIKNAMANSTLSDMMKVRKQSIRDSLSDFEDEEHRLEKVLRINGVQYINDSKAVNVNATYYTLDCIDVTSVWIVGGVDKGNDYESLLPLVNEKVKAIICLGYDNQKIIEAFGNIVEFMIETPSIEEAVKIAYKLTEHGEAVILSPACASYDMFENYKDRGNQFKNAVLIDTGYSDYYSMKYFPELELCRSICIDSNKFDDFKLKLDIKVFDNVQVLNDYVDEYIVNNKPSTEDIKKYITDKYNITNEPVNKIKFTKLFDDLVLDLSINNSYKTHIKHNTVGGHL